jgi:hypothetical protein
VVIGFAPDGPWGIVQEPLGGENAVGVAEQAKRVAQVSWIVEFIVLVEHQSAAAVKNFREQEIVDLEAWRVPCKFP